MDSEIKRHFRVGEYAEARSFEKGYRGAWFRCKIKKITRKQGHLGYLSEYIDFPDEKVQWTMFFEVPPHNVGKGEEHRELMLRPAYPPISKEKQIPSVVSKVTVIVYDSWKVGDLVDWWTTGCYWSGRITQLCGNDKAKIALKQPPLGEGSFYDILFKDIRPSLDWSLEHGWTIPTQEGDTGRPCARLIKPINQATPPPSVNSADIIREPAILNKPEETEARQLTAGSSVRLSLSSPVSSGSVKVSKEVKGTKKKTASQRNNVENSTRQKLGSGTTDSGQTSAEPAIEVAEDLNSGCSLKKKSKYKESKGATLNSDRSDTLEAAVMDLEEYINKVKWLKSILHNRILSSDDATSSQWEVVDTTSEKPKVNV